MIRQLDPTEEQGTVRVAIDGIAAIALTTAYKRVVAAQDEVITILDYACRDKGIEPRQVVGWDDERGEMLVRP